MKKLRTILRFFDCSWLGHCQRRLFSTLGGNVQATNLGSVAIGAGTRSFGQGSVAIGWDAYATGQGAVGTGWGTNAGTASPVEKLDVAGTAQMTGFRMPTGASAGLVLTSDASGVGTWQASASGDITDVGDCAIGACFTSTGTTGTSLWL